MEKPTAIEIIHQADAYLDEKLDAKLMQRICKVVDSAIEQWTAHLTASGTGEEWQVDFGNHVRAQLKIVDGKIFPISAIDGWGNDIPINQIATEYLPAPSNK